jgi:hypothetical protein
MSRRVTFTNNEIYNEMAFGDYAMLHFYAHKIDPIKADELHKVIIPEINYRLQNGLPENGLELGIDEEILFDAERLLLVLNFINDEIIPDLESRGEENIIEKYGGIEAVEAYISENLPAGVYNESYYETAEMIISPFSILAKYINWSLETGESYEVVF